MHLPNSPVELNYKNFWVTTKNLFCDGWMTQKLFFFFFTHFFFRQRTWMVWTGPQNNKVLSPPPTIIKYLASALCFSPISRPDRQLLSECILCIASSWHEWSAILGNSNLGEELSGKKKDAITQRPLDWFKLQCWRTTNIHLHDTLCVLLSVCVFVCANSSGKSQVEHLFSGRGN